jgi:hypothetical protein
MSEKDAVKVSESKIIKFKLNINILLPLSLYSFIFKSINSLYKLFDEVS